MGKIQGAVVGVGGIGSTHLRAYADHAALCKIVGVADIDSAAA